MRIKINDTFLRSLIIAFLLIILCSVFAGKYIAKRNRLNELSEQYCYEVYFTYVENRQTYMLYLMCNTDYTVADIIDNVFTDEYFVSLRKRIDNTETPSATATIYLILPSNEIPFGWEKSNLNIACNFDVSVFHRNTVCIVTIPYGAESLRECDIDYQKSTDISINLTTLDESSYEEG